MWYTLQKDFSSFVAYDKNIVAVSNYYQKLTANVAFVTLDKTICK
jgi:hypothetical protein